MAIKTKRGAIRRYNAIIRKCYQDAKGGTSFGVDMPTILALWPERYNEIKKIREQFAKLPE